MFTASVLRSRITCRDKELKMAGTGATVRSRGLSVSSSLRISLYAVAVFLLSIPVTHSQKLYFDSNEFYIIAGTSHPMQLKQEGQFNTSLVLTSKAIHPDIVELVPSSWDVPGGTNGSSTEFDFDVLGKTPGRTDVTFDATPAGYVDPNSVFLRITVMHSKTIQVISSIMGWIYFLAWSVSFYPQIYTNWKRKSVVGLNFDFLALNIYGFVMYSLFNCGLYFVKTMQDEYFSRHPRGTNPVQLNDVFFSVHAAFATIVTIIQCCLYERGGQRVSRIAQGFLGVFCTVVIATIICSVLGVIHWLDFLIYCSYIKLTITLIKYIPQAYMNYKRKSTVGWSIGNILLDFTGGFLSIFQMVLNGYNYNDWMPFLPQGDLAKFGLGLFSLSFDILFMLQHYLFYREGKEFVMVNTSDEGSNTSNDEGREYFIMINDWNADEKKYDLEHQNTNNQVQQVKAEARYIRLAGTTSDEPPTHDDQQDPTTEAPPYQGAPA